MKVNKLAIGATLASMLAIPNLYAAQAGNGSGYNEITAWPLEINFDSHLRYEDIKVTNLGGNKVYVKAVVTRVKNPGQADAKNIPFTSDPYKFGLTVNPIKQVIKVGKHTNIRVIRFAHAPQKDLVYHVNILPVLNPIRAGKQKPKKINTGVEIAVGYGVRVVIRPAHLAPHITVKRDGHEITFHNSGNTNVLLYAGKQCDAKKQCVKLSHLERMYAGQTWKFKAPKAWPVHYKIMLTDKYYKSISSK